MVKYFKAEKSTYARMTLEPHPEPESKLHLYHCDQRCLPLALINPDNTVAWRAEDDEWGNLLSEENPAHPEQLIRLPGQQYDEESGLHYNRHRYYSPGLGRYITQDPIGLEGGWNLYNYPLNPVTKIDPRGLNTAIIFNGPTEPHGGESIGNPAGHAAMAFTGKGVYSYGNNTVYSSNTINYLAGQSPRRFSEIYILNTTDAQEKAMMDYINKNYSEKSKYNILNHNCSTMVIDSLFSAGVARQGIAFSIKNQFPVYMPTTAQSVGMLESFEHIFISKNAAIPQALEEMK